MHGHKRDFWLPGELTLPTAPSKITRHSEEHLNYMLLEVVRITGGYTLEELDKTLDNIDLASRRITGEVTKASLLEAENYLRDAVHHLHNARVCCPTPNDFREYEIFQQGLRSQKKKVQGKA